MAIEVVTTDVPKEDLPWDGDDKPATAVAEEDYPSVVEYLKRWSILIDSLPLSFIMVNPSLERIAIVKHGRAYAGRMKSLEGHYNGMFLSLDDQDNSAFIHEWGHTLDPEFIIRSSLTIRHRIDYFGLTKNSTRKAIMDFANQYGYKLKEFTGDPEKDLGILSDLILQMFVKSREAWKILHRNNRYYDLSPNRGKGLWEGF